MDNKELTPKIRFAGFTDPWEQRKLSSLCEKFTDGDWIESKDQSDFGVRLVQTGNVGVAEYLDKPNSRKWISEETFKRLHCEEIFPGDILISRLPEPAGRACIMPSLGTKMITAVDCTIVRSSADVSNKFLVQYLSSQDYFNSVNTCLAGGTRQRVSRSNLAEFDVPIPSNKNEQDKIGELFCNLDNIITLHQRKYEKLQNIKKSMLEKMFPRDGSNIPEVRFAGFTDPWEQRKFSEFALRESAIQKSSDDYPSIEYEDVIAEEGRLNKDVQLKETQKPGIVFDGTQVLYGKLRPYLHNWLNPEFKGVAVGDWWVLRPVDIDKSFLYRLIQTQQFDQVANQSAGSKMPRADWNLVSNTTFNIPSSRVEQSHIATTFYDLDNLITLHQRKLEKLKNIKKSMLESMFV